MAVDGEDVPASVNETTEGTADRVTTVENKQKRLESLLLDGPEHGQAFEHISTQEVKVVRDRTEGRLSLLIGLLLFCVLPLGAGYYYLLKPETSKTLPSHKPLYASPRLPVPARPVIDLPVPTVAENLPASQPKKNLLATEPVAKEDLSLFTVMVGPLINSNEVDQATNQLRDIGLTPQEKKGRGQVVMIRLLLGVYPEEEARHHLDSLKKVTKSAFLLPEGDKLAVYAGSFHQQERAKRMQDSLALKNVDVTLVDSEIPMNSTMLIALQADEKTAREVAMHITGFGLQAQVFKTK
jgi:cell division septation protein DedD